MDHFYFIRHGETVWNVENKICGAIGIELTQRGHEQAIETGKKILAEEIYAVKPGEKITVEGRASILRIRAK